MSIPGRSTEFDSGPMATLVTQMKDEAMRSVGRAPNPQNGAYDPAYLTGGQQPAEPVNVQRFTRASLDLPEGTIALSVPADLTKKSRAQVRKWLSLMLDLAEDD